MRHSGEILRDGFAGNVTTLREVERDELCPLTRLGDARAKSK